MSHEWHRKRQGVRRVLKCASAAWLGCVGWRTAARWVLPIPPSAPSCRRRLLTNTRGRVLLNALLPRGDSERRPHAEIIGRWADGRPRRSLSPSIARVNQRLNASLNDETLLPFALRCVM